MSLSANQSEREAAVRAAFESAASRLPPDTTPEDFAAAVAAWACHPVKVDGRIVGAVLTLGPEVHACIKPEGFGRWLNRQLLRIVDDCIARFGCASTAANTEAGQRFVRRLGFKPFPVNPNRFLKVRHGH